MTTSSSDGGGERFFRVVGGAGTSGINVSGGKAANCAPQRRQHHHQQQQCGAARSASHRPGFRLRRSSSIPVGDDRHPEDKGPPAQVVVVPCARDRETGSSGRTCPAKKNEDDCGDPAAGSTAGLTLATATATTPDFCHVFDGLRFPEIVAKICDRLDGPSLARLRALNRSLCAAVDLHLSSSRSFRDLAGRWRGRDFRMSAFYPTRKRNLAFPRNVQTMCADHRNVALTLDNGQVEIYDRATRSLEHVVSRGRSRGPPTHIDMSDQVVLVASFSFVVFQSVAVPLHFSPVHPSKWIRLYCRRTMKLLRTFGKKWLKLGRKAATSPTAAAAAAAAVELDEASCPRLGPNNAIFFCSRNQVVRIHFGQRDRCTFEELQECFRRNPPITEVISTYDGSPGQVLGIRSFDFSAVEGGGGVAVGLVNHDRSSSGGHRPHWPRHRRRSSNSTDDGEGDDVDDEEHAEDCGEVKNYLHLTNSLPRSCDDNEEEAPTVRADEMILLRRHFRRDGEPPRPPPAESDGQQQHPGRWAGGGKIDGVKLRGATCVVQVSDNCGSFEFRSRMADPLVAFFVVDVPSRSVVRVIELGSHWLQGHPDLTPPSDVRLLSFNFDSHHLAIGFGSYTSRDGGLAYVEMSKVLSPAAMDQGTRPLEDEFVYLSTPRFHTESWEDHCGGVTSIHLEQTGFIVVNTCAHRLITRSCSETNMSSLMVQVLEYDFWERERRQPEFFPGNNKFEFSAASAAQNNLALDVL